MRKRRPIDYALFLLGQRSYSESMLLEKLDKKFNNPDENKAVIVKLKDSGLINDLEFAKSYLTSKSQYSFRGKKRIFFELIKKRVPKEIIVRVLDTYTKDDQLANAKIVLENNLLRLKDLDKATIYRRLVSLLTRQGFDQDIIYQVLDEKKT